VSIIEHLTSIHDLGKDGVEQVLEEAKRMAIGNHNKVLAGRTVCSAFFEPSTRTRLSFEAAAHRLGANVIGFSDGKSTSGAKGESLEDTARMLGSYADAVILRHPEVGAAKIAASVAGVPVINAGDGAGEHPTQTLIDLFTIQQELGRLDVKIGFVGDLRHGRTVHSLAPAMKWFGADIVQVPAWGLEMPDNSIPQSGLGAAAAECDVLYVTRIQKERFDDANAYHQADGSFRVDKELLETNKSKAIIMHPLPRVDELATDVDNLSTAKYFDQARNAVPVRMAVLKMLLEASS
jgi:aspartate carbamoyltransferase catalytic subunit